MIEERDILSAKILVVDDNPVNVELLSRILEFAGFTNFRGEVDPRKVLAVYTEFRPDLVLLDLMMPYIDGFEILEKLPELEPDSYVSVLVLTALSDRETRLRALANGAKDFITKPFDDTETINRIRNLLEIRLSHNALRDQNVVLEQKVRERTRALHETRLEIIRRLGMAAEYKDMQTGAHIVRMSRMAERLACAAGLDEERCQLIFNASPMHDVGKIGVPDSILQKPGPLDDDEWVVMKTHTTMGYELLSGNDSDLLATARVIAVSHHERWDGTGYPEGLAGDWIPAEGRICAICDVFDALISRRPYKPPWSIEAAFEHIVRGAGKQFDPDLVALFERSFGELVGNIEEYAGTGRNPRL
jgi:cyclic di-GMP phosphodiesterase